MAQKRLWGLLLIAIASTQAISAREWTNPAGETFEAEFVASDATHVRLKQPNGETLSIARDQLGEEDRNWLDRRERQSAANPASPPVSATPGPSDELAKALEVLGATVNRDPNDPRHPIVAVDLHGLQIMDGHLALLQGIETLKRLDLSGCFITASDAGLANLATLSGLEELTLYDARNGNDRWLAPLSKLTNLKSLNLDVPLVRFVAALHDDAFASLKHLTKMEHLTLSGPGITDASMPYLEEMPNLRELQLLWTCVTNAGIANLKRFPHLRKLWIRNESYLDNDGMKVLADLPELEFLMLSGYSFTGDVLKHVRAPQLREVGIEGQRFADEVFPHLQAFPNTPVRSW